MAASSTAATEILPMLLFLELVGLALSTTAHVIRAVGAHARRFPHLTNENKEMNNDASITDNNKNSFFSRVFDNDALKKGVAAAAAGVLIAIVSEVIWPSES